MFTKHTGKFINKHSGMKEYKVVLVGDAFVGKTTFLYKLKGINEETKTSVASQYYSYEFSTETEKIILYLWDTAGSEKYSSFMTQYVRDADIELIFFAYDNEDSYKNVHEWHKMLSDVVKKDAKSIVLGNKLDLVNDDQKSNFPFSVFDFTQHYMDLSCATLQNFDKTVDLICKIAMSLDSNQCLSITKPLKTSQEKKCC